MNNRNYFKDLFESIHDYRKIVLLIFLIQNDKNLLKENNFWLTRYTIPKNDQYSNTSSEWTLLNLNFTEDNYGIKLIYDQIDSPHADMCFSNISITHSVY